jgi:hypothetical protein
VERTPDDQHQHLLEEAQQLYENELLWEEESEEEFTDTGTVTELVFPGTLALVDALVTSHTPNEHGEGGPHRDVVYGFMSWLVDRVVRLRSGEIGGDRALRARKVDLTERLIDLVIYRYLGLTDEEIERLETPRQ